MTPEELEALSEDGKKEVKQISITHKGKIYSAAFVMDFKLYRKAYNIAISPEFKTPAKAKGVKSEAQVSVSMDIIGAGDEVLFKAYHSGDKFESKMVLRAKATQLLGEWILSLSTDEDEDNDEKKA